MKQKTAAFQAFAELGGCRRTLADFPRKDTVERETGIELVVQVVDL